MQGTVAQLLSIAAHGNEYLKGHLDKDYFPGSSTFKFCKFVKFVDLQSTGTTWVENGFADNPNIWFEKLKNTGVIQFRVRYISTNNEQISDRMSAGFVGGGGRWLIEAVKSAKSDFWEASWEVGDKDDPDQNIWHVKYGRILRNANKPEDTLPSVSKIKDQLKDALKQISNFAYKNDCENFGKCFDRAISALSGDPLVDFEGYKIFPDNYASLEHRQLLIACQSAWVFGGMGSWNDMGFDDDEIHKEYEQLSDTLFNLINLSLLVASNPYARPGMEIPKQKNKWYKFW